MRGEITIQGQKAYKLRLTLGSVESIPADDSTSPPVPFLPANVLNQLAGAIYSARDVRVVIEAGIAGSGLDLTYEKLFDEVGFKPLTTAALELLMAFFGIEPSGKADAASENQKTREAPAS